ncbi:MAG: hypothetical protein ACI4WX_00655 [Aristaeellaceae bacterium]
MYEPTCYDPDWERYCTDPAPATEDEWWERYCDDQAALEADARAYAEDMAALFEFDTDEERDAYIDEKMEEYAACNTR